MIVNDRELEKASMLFSDYIFLVNTAFIDSQENSKGLSWELFSLELSQELKTAVDEIADRYEFNFYKSMTK